MTREEAREAVREAYGNSEYTDEIIKALEQDGMSSKQINFIETIFKKKLQQYEIDNISFLLSLTDKEIHEIMLNRGRENSKEFNTRCLFAALLIRYNEI